MVRRNWNNCSPTGANITLLTGAGGCDCDVYEETWEVKESNRGQSVYPIIHPFGRKFLEVFVYDLNSSQPVGTAVYYVADGLLTVGFTSPPKVGQRFKIRIVYHGEHE